MHPAAAIHEREFEKPLLEKSKSSEENSLEGQQTTVLGANQMVVSATVHMVDAAQ
jgi:hypothetical protein